MNAVAVYCTPNDSEATAENGYEVGPSGNQDDMSASKGQGERYEFPCNHEQTFDTTITLVGANGQTESRSVTFTDINWGQSSDDEDEQARAPGSPLAAGEFALQGRCRAFGLPGHARCADARTLDQCGVRPAVLREPGDGVEPGDGQRRSWWTPSWRCIDICRCIAWSRGESEVNIDQRRYSANVRQRIHYYPWFCRACSSVGRASDFRNPPVVGSSPTGPTYLFVRRSTCHACTSPTHS